jgi:hypothetical protein
MSQQAQHTTRRDLPGGDLVHDRPRFVRSVHQVAGQFAASHVLVLDRCPVGADVCRGIAGTESEDHANLAQRHADLSERRDESSLIELSWRVEAVARIGVDAGGRNSPSSSYRRRALGDNRDCCANSPMLTRHTGDSLVPGGCPAGQTVRPAPRARSRAASRRTRTGTARSARVNGRDTIVQHSRGEDPAVPMSEPASTRGGRRRDPRRPHARPAATTTTPLRS